MFLHVIVNRIVRSRLHVTPTMDTLVGGKLSLCTTSDRSHEAGRVYVQCDVHGALLFLAEPL